MDNDLLAMIGGAAEFKRRQSDLLKAMQADFKRLRESDSAPLSFTKGHAALLRVTFPSLLVDLATRNLILEMAYQRVALLSAARLDALQAKVDALEAGRAAPSPLDAPARAGDPGTVVRLRDIAAA